SSPARSTRPGAPWIGEAPRCEWRPTGWRFNGSQKPPRRAAYIPKVVLYHAQGCHLCERARNVMEAARAEIAFDFEEVDIGGNPELEARYREWLPVVEIDGTRAFVYYVDRGALLRRLTSRSG